MTRHLISAIAILPLLLGTASAQPAPTYRTTQSIKLGAPDRWDYVVFDGASGRVYVAHGDRVTVIDGHDGHVLGNVDGLASAFRPAPARASPMTARPALPPPSISRP
jgi:DNA-binding beta-propeller fold protein YncE